MLKVEGVISSLFQLVLEVPSKPTSNAINKALGVSKVFLEEVIKLRPHYQSGAFVAAFLLGPSEANGVAEENSDK